jgi:Ca-activated chloride channel family protein
MKKSITFGLTFLFVGISYLISAQVTFDKKQHDFSELYATDEHFVDIPIKNNGTKKVFFLTVKKPKEVTYLLSNDLIGADSSIIFRLKVNPKKTGNFKYTVEVFTSDKDEPTIINLIGNIKEFEENALAAFQSCPDFKEKPARTVTDFNFTVVTIDKETKELIPNSAVSMLQNGQNIANWRTDRKGEKIGKIPLGYTYFYATNENYFPSEMGTYVNFQRNKVVLELERKPIIVVLEEPLLAKEEKPKPKEIEIVIEQEETSKPVKEAKPVKESKPIKEPKSVVEAPKVKEEQVAENTPFTLEGQLAENVVEPVFASADIKLKNIPFEEFDETYFKPVNVVFVLDVSSSMLAGNKLELLKFSLFELIEYLRPQDQMAVVAYSSKTRLLFGSTSANEKETMKKPIERLRAAGGTAGGDGIKMGFEQAAKGYLKDGANTVIIITDGAFNKNSDDYQQSIKKYKEQGITFSVVGIQNAERDEAKMREAADIGNGRYVRISKLADAQRNLIQEIRFIAYRK